MKKFEIFIAQNTINGYVMYGIRCSHGFVKYTESKEAANACVKAWNKQKKIKKNK